MNDMNFPRKFGTVMDDKANEFQIDLEQYATFLSDPPGTAYELIEIKGGHLTTIKTMRRRSELQLISA